MLTKINNIVLSTFVLLSCSLGFASPTELFHLNQKVAGFVNYSTPASTIFISETGSLFMLTDLKLQQGITYQIDPACNLKTQNTSSMDGSEGGMILAYPYFVSLGKVCRFDNEQKQIRLVADFTKDLPQNNFSLSYAGGDDSNVYFVLNGRVYPDGQAGYIYSVAISRKNNSVSIRPFINDVPGFSAAMVYGSGQLWITTWMGKNQIFKIPAMNLLTMLQGANSYKFSDVASQVSDSFPGLSSYVLKNESDFLYYNNEFDSYSVSTVTKSGPQPFKSSCEPVNGYKSQWILLCDSNSIVLQ